MVIESQSHDPGDTSGLPRHRYTAELAARIEAKWQDWWESSGTFETPYPPEQPVVVGTDEDAGGSAREKFFLLDMFPYPSGATLHVGHPLGYIATDVYGRYLRMTGHNVLHAMGYDAFGLPAEQYAVQTGSHPREVTEANIATMREQLRRLGLGHDRRRSVVTTDPAFYRWTQWMFLQMFNSFYDEDACRARPIGRLVEAFEMGGRPVPGGRPWSELSGSERRSVVDGQRLAYLDDAPVNWCPGLGTVLADEEVNAEGRSERGNFPVFRRNLRQWKLRITAYADRLLADLDLLDWPEPIKLMQRNWIGRSEGSTIRFPIHGSESVVEVFTTRPDTLFGATAIVLSPDHPLLETITDRGGGTGKASSEQPFTDAAGFTGAYAVHPTTGASVPVFAADYVVSGYGAGAVMAVPAHDRRDFEFANRAGIPVVPVVTPPADWPADAADWTDAWVGDGTVVGSAAMDLNLDGLRVAEAAETVVRWLESTGRGRRHVTYRLRDWLFSRQRYWGEPFPIVYDEDDLPVALGEEMLPVTLPDVVDFSPVVFDPDDASSDPVPPLRRAEAWTRVALDLGGGEGVRVYRREPNTMPQWAGSCWYYLRYLDPENDRTFCDPRLERYWMGPRAGGSARGRQDPGGVDLYVGGVEHAVLHLLYARFWHKVLYDLGHVSSSEPFRRLFNQGYVQAAAYTDAAGSYVPAHEVVEHDGTFTWQDKLVMKRYGKMGKSLKNAITPDEFCAEYGADTLRLYEMSMAPLDASRPWDTRAVSGSFRFLQRLWRNLLDEDSGEVRVSEHPAGEETRRLLHRTIAAVRDDYSALRFNTAIARLTELNNHLTATVAPGAVPRDVAEPLVLLVAPLVPHVAEELWERLGHRRTLTYEPFPVPDPDLLTDENVICVVQVAGKLRDRIEVRADIGEQELVERALASERVGVALAGRPVTRTIVLLPRLVNFVTG